MNPSPSLTWRNHSKRNLHLGKTGVLVGFTLVHSAPPGLIHHTPYYLGLIRIDSKLHIAQLVDLKPESLKKGLKLVGKLRRLVEPNANGLIQYGVKFGPIIPPNSNNTTPQKKLKISK